MAKIRELEIQAAEKEKQAVAERENQKNSFKQVMEKTLQRLNTLETALKTKESQPKPTVEPEPASKKPDEKQPVNEPKKPQPAVESDEEEGDEDDNDDDEEEEETSITTPSGKTVPLTLYIYL